MSDEKKIYPEGSGDFGAPDNGRPGKVEIDKDDIKEHTKATLKDYLSRLTHEKKNAFPISHTSIEDPRTKEKTSLDEEIGIHANSEERIAEIRTDTNDSQFVSLAGDSESARGLRSNSDSGKFTDLEDKTATLKTFFDKNARGQGHNLLRDIKVPIKKVAIELNQEIVDKKKIKSINLKNNDKIEIVHFIGGG